MAYSEREEIKEAKKIFREHKHDGVKGRDEHTFIVGWLEKALLDYRKTALGTKCPRCGSIMYTKTECILRCEK